MNGFYYIRLGEVVSFPFELDERYEIGRDISEDHSCFIPLSRAQVEYYESHPGATAHEVWIMSKSEDQAPTIEAVLTMKISEIERWHNSPEVNHFTFMGKEPWFDLNQRLAFKAAVDARIILGIPTITPPHQDLVGVNLPCQSARVMISKLETYASDCEAKKAKDIVALNILKEAGDKEGIEKYNYKVNMPTPLNFDNA